MAKPEGVMGLGRENVDRNMEVPRCEPTLHELGPDSAWGLWQSASTQLEHALFDSTGTWYWLTSTRADQAGILVGILPILKRVRGCFAALERAATCVGGVRAVPSSRRQRRVKRVMCDEALITQLGPPRTWTDVRLVFASNSRSSQQSEKFLVQSLQQKTGPRHGQYESRVGSAPRLHVEEPSCPPPTT